MRLDKMTPKIRKSAEIEHIRIGKNLNPEFLEPPLWFERNTLRYLMQFFVKSFYFIFYRFSDTLKGEKWKIKH